MEDRDELNNEALILAGFSSDISGDIMHLANISEEELPSFWTYHSPKWVQLPVHHRYEVPWRLTPNTPHLQIAAAIPPELFDRILSFVGYDHSTKGIRASVLRWKGGSGTDFEDRLHNVKMCSLVCLYWANLCRRLMFSGAKFVVSSSGDVQRFLAFAVQGIRCPRLSPILELIGSLHVEQTYQESLPFCHRLLTQTTQAKLGTLQLCGPIPLDFHKRHRNSPVWGLPPSVVIAPRQLGYRWITVKDIHFPSFSHANQYITHLLRAKHLQFQHVTWDEGGEDPPLALSRKAQSLRATPDNIVSVEASGCTDNFRLCIRVAAAHPQFILHALGDRDQRQRAISLIISFLGFHTAGPDAECHIFGSTGLDKPGPWEWPTLNVMLRAKSQNKRGANMTSTRLQLTFGQYDDVMQVIGLIAFLGWKDVTIEPDHWVAQILESFPTVRTIVFEFVNFERLQPIAMARLHSDYAGNPFANGDVSFKLVCGLSHQYSFPDVVGVRPYGNDICVDIDPSTLTPTGRYWGHSNEIIPSLLGSRQHGD